MKKLLIALLCLGLLTSSAYASWRFNPHTGKLDYYEAGGSGDVTSVGDCTTGACLDGTSDGGTYISFYDAQGAGTLITPDIAGAVTWTLPTTAGTLLHTEVDPTVDTSGEIIGILGYTPSYQWTVAGTSGADLIGNSAETWTLVGAGGNSTAESSNTMTITWTSAGLGWNGDAISVAKGGTNRSSWTLYDIPYASGTTTLVGIPVGTAGQVLAVNAGANGYNWTADAGGAETNSLETVCTGIANTEIFIGTGANAGNYAAIGGEATMSNAGAITIADSVTVASWTIDSPVITTAITATGLIKAADMANADHGDISWTAGVASVDDSIAVTSWNLTTPTITTSIDLPAGAINTATEIAADIITHAQILDADQADTKCLYWEDPVATDDFNSIWANKTANDFLITEIWAESDQTVTFMLQVDDGTPADVDSVDLAPAAGEAEDTSLDGDTTVAAGEELDLAVTSVANTPTWCSICFTGNWVD